MDEHFGHPHNQYKCIHIAGTNGKGSSSHTLAAILQSQGYKVGLFTSPHLVDFRERIRVNGEMVSEEYVIDFVKNNRKFFEPLHPSFFELTTMMAFKYFAEQKVRLCRHRSWTGRKTWTAPTLSPLSYPSSRISVSDHTQFLGKHTWLRSQAKKRASSSQEYQSLLEKTCRDTSCFPAKGTEQKTLLSF